MFTNNKVYKSWTDSIIFFCNLTGLKTHNYRFWLSYINFFLVEKNGTLVVILFGGVVVVVPLTNVVPT